MVMTPERFMSNNAAAKQLVELVEAKFKEVKEAGSWDGSNAIEVAIDGEFTPQLRDKVVERYTKAGWPNVEHTTSSESGGKPGLTIFTFHLGGAG
jgi:hypothetical protein